MKIYYDTHPFYSYICLKDINKVDVPSFVNHLKERGVTISKFYEKPKYPAHDGNTYDFLLRLNFKDSVKKIKHGRDHIEKVIEEYTGSSKTTDQDSKKEHERLLEIERKYFEQIRNHIDSERRVLEIDKKFFNEQVENLTLITSNLKKENDRIFNFVESFNSRVNNEIEKIFTSNRLDNKELKALKEKLQEKEEALKKKDRSIKAKESEIELQRKSNEKYRTELEEHKQKLDEQYSGMVQDIRNMYLGIENEGDEDTIQDLKVLVFGQCSISEEEIYDIFNQEFISVFGEKLEKKCISGKHLTYNSVKNSDINNQIKKDKFDYIIVGPQPHSTKNKPLKIGYTEWVKQNNLKAIVNQDSFKKPLNREKLTELAQIIITHWKDKFKAN